MTGRKKRARVFKPKPQKVPAGANEAGG